MNGEWKVVKNVMLGDKPYEICRLIDDTKPMHSGNVEYLDNFETDDKQEALALAYELNVLNEI